MATPSAAADVRVASEDATVGLLEIRWGLVPDMTGTVTLPELVRMDVARELVYTGRTVTAPEAVGLGLLTRVSADPLAEAMALAGDIAGRSPEAVAAAKRLLAVATGNDAPSQLAAERLAQDPLVGSPAQREAVAAHFAGRPPVFED
jgi:enoyl-CoA hydratase/carnithine racemase